MPNRYQQPHPQVNRRNSAPHDSYEVSLVSDTRRVEISENHRFALEAPSPTRYPRALGYDAWRPTPGAGTSGTYQQGVDEGGYTPQRYEDADQNQSSVATSTSDSGEDAGADGDTESFTTSTDVTHDHYTVCIMSKPIAIDIC
jgi:hypothetical protein